MNVTVLFHSYFRELTGCDSARVELPTSAPVSALLAELHQRFPKLKTMERSTLLAVDVEYQSADYLLREGDEVSLFPPVQGG